MFYHNFFILCGKCFTAIGILLPTRPKSLIGTKPSRQSYSSSTSGQDCLDESKAFHILSFRKTLVNVSVQRVLNIADKSSTNYTGQQMPQTGGNADVDDFNMKSKRHVFTTRTSWIFLDELTKQILRKKKGFELLVIYHVTLLNYYYFI